MSDTIGQSNNRPTRPAWLEVNLGQLAENFRLIRADAPDGLAIGSVVKDAAYGHGAVGVARVALGQGAESLLVSNLDEAAELRDAGITAPVLLMGERMESELSACLELGLTLAIGNAPTALFHLLNMLEDPDCPRPAAIIGCPVGFVGAAESKAALWAAPPVPCCIVDGRLGGSAITVAAINALASRAE